MKIDSPIAYEDALWLVEYWSSDMSPGSYAEGMVQRLRAAIAVYEAERAGDVRHQQRPLSSESVRAVMRAIVIDTGGPHAGGVEWFRENVGREPADDDLARANCQDAGRIGHLFCGICEEHNQPRFVCGCVPRMP